MMENMTFEAAMQRLNEIAETIAQGVSLEKSLELFEEGTKLAAFCSKQLEAAELKIKTLSEGNASDE